MYSFVWADTNQRLFEYYSEGTKYLIHFIERLTREGIFT